MNHKNNFEALDITLIDILGINNLDTEKKSFGSKIVLLGGDFRHILLVVIGGSRAEIIDALISQSYLAKYCRIYSFKKICNYLVKSWMKSTGKKLSTSTNGFWMSVMEKYQH